MYEAFDSVNVYKSSEVYNSCNYSFDRVSNLKFAKTSLEIVFNRLFLRENKLIVLAAYVKNPYSKWLISKRMKFL